MSLSHDEITKLNAWTRQNASQAYDQVTYWLPREGEALRGIIKAMRKQITAFAEQIVVEVRTEAGLYSFFLTEYLQKGFKLKNVEVGDLIDLTYEGKKPNGKGSVYKSYKLNTKKQS